MNVYHPDKQLYAAIQGKNTSEGGAFYLWIYLIEQGLWEDAKMFSVRSDSWTAYMEIVEKECEAFQQSSKSLFYIGEQFKLLQISIEEAQGKVPGESED